MGISRSRLRSICNLDRAARSRKQGFSRVLLLLRLGLGRQSPRAPRSLTGQIGGASSIFFYRVNLCSVSFDVAITHLLLLLEQSIGKLKVNTEPCPMWLTTLIVPPWASTDCFCDRQTHSGSRNPGAATTLCLDKIGRRFGLISDSPIPGPVSATPETPRHTIFFFRGANALSILGEKNTGRRFESGEQEPFLSS